MNRSLADIGGQVLVVSQFTLYADCRKGKRPSFTGAALPELAVPLYEQFLQECRSRGSAGSAPICLSPRKTTAPSPSCSIRTSCSSREEAEPGRSGEPPICTGCR